MTIYLFGTSCVGKSTTGKMLAYRLGYIFYDMDEETKAFYNTTLEDFVNTGTLEQRDRKRFKLLQHLNKDTRDKVIAVTPISYMAPFRRLLEKDALAIELVDTPEHIFNRIVFSDENDNLYQDDAYKNAHREAYLKEIKEDYNYYHPIWRLEHQFDMNGDPPDEVVDRLVKWLQSIQVQDMRNTGTTDCKENTTE